MIHIDLKNEKVIKITGDIDQVISEVARALHHIYESAVECLGQEEADKMVEIVAMLAKADADELEELAKEIEKKRFMGG